MVTMKDVAKRAGVSVFTVSSVINNTYTVSNNLKKRVNKAIEELNYIPNQIAKSLKRKKSNLIGIIISDIEDIFFTKIIKGIEEVVYKFGFNILLSNTMNDPEKEKRYIQIMMQKRVEGLIIFTTNKNLKDLEKVLIMKIPIVLIDREIKESNISAVIMNDYDASFNAIDYLIKKGHKDIAIITFPTEIYTSNERLNGYNDSIKKNNIEVKSEYIKIVSFQKENSFKATNELLNLKNVPTALFTTNDVMFAGALKAITDKRLQIPDDISIITFYDFEWLKYLNPPITAIKIPTFEMGQQSAKMLLEIIDSNNKFYFRKITLNTKLIERKSVKKLN